jgi:hypothetical protein
MVLACFEAVLYPDSTFFIESLSNDAETFLEVVIIEFTMHAIRCGLERHSLELRPVLNFSLFPQNNSLRLISS